MLTFLSNFLNTETTEPSVSVMIELNVLHTNAGKQLSLAALDV